MGLRLLTVKCSEFSAHKLHAKLLHEPKLLNAMFSAHTMQHYCRKKACHVEPKKHLHDIRGLPILGNPKQKLQARGYFEMLLDPQLAKDHICSMVPFSVNCSSIFVVDLSNIRSVRDILVDDMGVWQWKGSYRVWCSVEDSEVVNAGRNRPNSEHAYQIWQRYYVNKTSPDVKKYVVLLYGE